MGTRPRLPRTRRLRMATAVVAVLLLGAAAGSAFLLQRDDEQVAEPERATGTATVQRRDLAVTEKVTGTLGYGQGRSITVPRAGVVTMLAAEGVTVTAGRALYAIDREPTVVLAGKEPAYRALDTDSSDGPDIRQLEQALTTLGYGDDLTVDDAFSSATADAVERWEDDLGRSDPDGRVELGDVLFSTGPVRVTTQTVAPGAQVQVGSAVLEVSSTTKVVDLDLDADWADTVAVGDTVALALPDGADSTGTVTSIGSARTDSSDPEAGSTVPLVITLRQQKAAAAFDSGSVDVTVERSRQAGVFTVPVTALVALSEGGYALEVVDRTSPRGHRLLGVTLGTVSDSVAAVSGDGVQAGLTVVVPA